MPAFICYSCADATAVVNNEQPVVIPCKCDWCGKTRIGVLTTNIPALKIPSEPHSIPKTDIYRDDEQTGVFVLIREFTIVRCFHCPDFTPGTFKYNGRCGHPGCPSISRDGLFTIGADKPPMWCPHRKENRQ